MKILFFGNSLKYMIHFRWHVIKHLAHQGHEIFIVAPNDVDKKSHKNLFENIHIFNSGFCRKTKLYRDIKALFQYIRYLKQTKPDVVMSYSAKPSLFSMIASWRRHNVYFITGLGSGFINKRYRFWVCSLFFLLNRMRCLANKSYSDIFIFLNNDDRTYFASHQLCNIDNTLVFPGEGIDLNSYRASPVITDRPYVKFLFIGRLIKDKGIMELMDACRLLKENGTKFECTVIGFIDQDNPSGRNMLFDQKNFAQCGINYIDQVDDVRPYINSHDVLILPSYGEGLPLVLLEGMAMGRPIVTTDVNGCRDLVVHKKNGFTVKPKDMNDLYHAMKTITQETRQILKNMGLVGSKIVKEKYSTVCVSDNYRRLIDNINNKREATGKINN